MDSKSLESQLSHFTGTEQWYRHALNRNFLYTDGVKYFAENAGGGAYWLLDIVATEIYELQKQEPFISMAYRVEDGKGVISASDGDMKKVYTRLIDHTDTPDGEWKFYVIDNVMLLPSEY